MPHATGLRRDNSGIYHLRIAVPEEVQPYWPRQPNGKMTVDAFRKSLRTLDRTKAVTEAHARLANCQKQCAALRDQHRPSLTKLPADDYLGRPLASWCRYLLIVPTKALRTSV